MHIIVALGSRHIGVRSHGVSLFLSAPHGVIVELSTLLLNLVVADVKSIASKAMIAHFLLKVIIICRWTLCEHCCLVMLKSVRCTVRIDVVRVVFWIRPRLVVVLLGLVVLLLLRVRYLLRILIVVQSVLLPTLKRVVLVFLRNGYLFLVL